MKFFKKLISLSIAIILLVAVLSACAMFERAEPEQVVPEDPVAPEEQVEPEEPVVPKDPITHTGPSWTLDTTSITLSLYMHEGWYTKQWNPEENIRDRAIFDATGVNFEISVPTGDAQERLNTMIAGGDLPDILILGWWFEQFRLMQSAGMLHNLNELIDNYAPDFREIIPQSMIDWYTYEDGNWYGFPNFFWASEHLEIWDVPLQTNIGMYARQDIMDDLGINPQDFNTQDGMVEILKKVRDSNIVYDGFQVRPLALGPGVGTGEWINFFAVPREDAEGNLVDVRTTREYLEVVQFLNRLYREGLIYAENFIDLRQQINERKTIGEIFAFVGNTADYTGAIRDLYNHDNEAKFVPVGPVRANDGDEPILASAGTGGWQVVAISRNTEHPDRAIRALHYLYSDEGQKVTSFGVEGVTYNIIDGRVQWTQEFLDASEEDPDGAGRIYGDGGGLWWMHNPVMIRGIQPAPATVPEQLHADIWNHFGKYVFNDLAFNGLSPPGGTDESAMEAEIFTFWAAQVPKMIMAESPDAVERIWSESVDHAKELGLERVLEVMNERFRANKEKLGIEFAWPGNLR